MVVRLVFFLLAIANVFLVWRHFDELMLIGAPAEAQESSDVAVLTELPELSKSNNNPIEDTAALDETLAVQQDGLASTANVLQDKKPSRLEVSSHIESQLLTADNSRPVAKLPRQCYWAGPLDANESAGDALMDRLRALRIGVSDHRVRTAGPDRFWVIIPRRGLKDGAASAIAALKKASVDSYEIGRGEHAGAVSLGFYSREQLAHARVEKAARLGWASEIIHVATNKHQQWLQVDKQQADAVGEGILARMVKNNSGVEIIEKKCELPVASHNNIH